MQHALFNAPVLVKPLGIVLPPDAFYGPATLSISMKRHFSLITPTESTNELYVKSEVQAFFNVSVVLLTQHLKLLEGATAFNKAMADELAESLKAVATTAEPVKRGRRRKAVEAEVDEEDEDEVSVQVPMLTARTFSAMLVKYDESPVPLSESVPYKTVASRSEDNESKLESQLAKINKYVRFITEKRNNMRAPDPTLDNALTAFMPTLDNDLESLDRQGLDTYEAGLKNQLAEVENRLREGYKFFEEKVVAAYNKSAGSVTKPFTGEYRMNDTVTSLDEFLTAIREEVFVPVKF